MRTLRLLASSLTLLALGCGAAKPAATPAPTTPTAAVRHLGVSATPPPKEPAEKMKWVLAGEHRSAEARARDVYRHPAETLAFFGLKEDMNVVEIWAGGGWYSEILAPLLAERGHLAVAGSRAVAGRIDKEPALMGKVELRAVKPPDDIRFGPDATADMLLTFRNHHNWIAGGIDEKVFRAAFAVLKPGGVFGYVEHRAKEGADPAAAKDTGYVPEAYAVALAEKVGFKLADRSEINANPKDTKDYAAGVWALPPALAGGDKDRARFTAIGESDRMTLKFVKP